MSKKARGSKSSKGRRMKSVHVDRLAEKLVQGLLGPELLAELEQTALEATTTTDGVSGTEWNDVEQAAEQEPSRDIVDASEANPEPELGS